MIILRRHLAKLAPRLPQDRRRGRVGGYPTYPNGQPQQTIKEEQCTSQSRGRAPP